MLELKWKGFDVVVRGQKWLGCHRLSIFNFRIFRDISGMKLNASGLLSQGKGSKQITKAPVSYVCVLVKELLRIFIAFVFCV